MNNKVVLLSSSPRRIELLKKIVKNFEVKSPSFDEEKTDKLGAKKLVVFNALGKINSIPHENNKIYISCDTVVSFNDKVIGKPIDQENCVSMLKLLSGNTHEVLTGIAIGNGKNVLNEVVVTKVIFNKLSDSQIKEYIKKFQPLDKAGGYGIQDNFPLVKSIVGDYENVMGFPTKTIQDLLQKFDEKFLKRLH